MFINYMKLNFKGKTAVVTGASGGMGLATVDQLCLLGIKVLMIDTRWKRLAAARLEGIETYYGDALSAETMDYINISSYGFFYFKENKNKKR